MKPQDFERLSAYIDNQLASGEKAALEQRLAREPELRDALRELRLTVKAVRALPTVTPPRNFTLTPAQAGLPAGGRAPRRGGLFPTLRLAASLSAVALAIVVGGDLAATQGLLGTAASPAQDVVFTTTVEEPMAAQAVAPTATPEGELSIMSAEAAPTETVIAESVPAGAGGGVTPTEEPTPGAEAALLPVTSTPTPSAERSAAVTPADETVAADVATTDLYEATESVKALPPADETVTALYAAGTPPAPGTAPAPAPGFPPLRVLEAALAMLTVLLGLGAWLASRNP